MSKQFRVVGRVIDGEKTLGYVITPDVLGDITQTHKIQQRIIPVQQLEVLVHEGKVVNFERDSSGLKCTENSIKRLPKYNRSGRREDIDNRVIILASIQGKDFKEDMYRIIDEKDNLRTVTVGMLYNLLYTDNSVSTDYILVNAKLVKRNDTLRVSRILGDMPVHKVDGTASKKSKEVTPRNKYISNARLMHKALEGYLKRGTFLVNTPSKAKRIGYFHNEVTGVLYPQLVPYIKGYEDVMVTITSLLIFADNKGIMSLKDENSLLTSKEFVDTKPKLRPNKIASVVPVVYKTRAELKELDDKVLRGKKVNAKLKWGYKALPIELIQAVSDINSDIGNMLTLGNKLVTREYVAKDKVAEEVQLTGSHPILQKRFDATLQACNIGEHFRGRRIKPSYNTSNLDYSFDSRGTNDLFGLVKESDGRYREVESELFMKPLEQREINFYMGVNLTEYHDLINVYGDAQIIRMLVCAKRNEPSDELRHFANQLEGRKVDLHSEINKLSGKITKSLSVLLLLFNTPLYDKLKEYTITANIDTYAKDLKARGYTLEDVLYYESGCRFGKSVVLKHSEWWGGKDLNTIPSTLRAAMNVVNK